MSAYVESKRHIDALVDFALFQGSEHGRFTYYHGAQRYELALGDGDDETGAMLWNENVRSVRYRYPDSDGNNLPGPVGLTPGMVDTYRFEALAQPLTPVEVLMALAGYEYQSCEHPEWATSRAHAFCGALRRAAIDALPGYDEADTWSIGDDRPVRQVFSLASLARQGRTTRGAR